MIDTLTATALDFYARHGAALFPIPYGSKTPTGIVGSFKHDFSRDPAQWAAWQSSHPNCNFGVVAFASQWIIMDTDTSGGDAGRTEAWALRCELFTAWGLDPALLPHVQSARGGWHDYFQVPAHIDASTLRQPDAIKKRINIRCVGFTVAAGSYYDGTAKSEQSGAYLLLSDAPPHPAPDALIEHCTPAQRTLSATPTGDKDRGDVAGLLNWLNERDCFSSYEDWLAIGMALKIEFGDSGLELWQLTHDETVDGDTEYSKWRSFATDPTGSSVTLQTFLQRAHNLGWRGTVRKSTSSMFDGVAAIAAAAGASLSSGMPLPPGPAGMPMLAGQEVLTELATPILLEFLSVTSDAPARPIADDFPTLPPSMEGHGLYAPMQTCIERVVAMAEPPQKFKKSRVTSAMIVLSVLHQDIYEAVRRRVEAMGHGLEDRKIKLGANALSDQVQRAFVKQDDWIYDAKSGLPESDNPDNVVVFLEIIGCEVRFNAWLERMEIRGGTDVNLRWPEWTYIDDTVVAKLRMRALRDKTRFKIGKEFAWEALLALAHNNPVDPVIDLLATLESTWDGKPRLMTWLSAYCHLPCDPYHQAVGRSLIGGMIARVRDPGIKFDTMPIFFGPQGTGKSTMLNILALRPEYFTDNILLGDASKELVLSLAGKMLVEISEMGMRGNTNASHVKAMISRTTDAGRTAYARSVTERPRRNIFCGSTNDDSPLEDPSGNRRFLPVRIDREIDLAGLRRDIEQIIAEAAHQHTAGADFSIPREVWAIAATHQEAARSVGDIESRLCTWFAAGPHTASAFVSTEDLADLCDFAGWRNVHSMRNAILKKLGFREVQPYINGVRTRGWLRGPDMLPRHVAEVTRYLVSKSPTDGRPRVTIRAMGTSPSVPLPPA